MRGGGLLARRSSRCASLAIALAGGLVCALWLAPQRADATRDDYGAKAAFLVNFARLVVWPMAARPAPGEPLVIGVVGGAAARQAIAQGVGDASVESHRIEVRNVEKPEQVAGTHILFVAEGRDADVAALIQAARGHASLSVGESDGFAARGGIVNFFSEGEKLRFEINLAAARATGLQISSRMLGLARLVETDE
jgi:hypothetical protein